MNRATSQRIARSKRRVTERREAMVMRIVMEKLESAFRLGPEIEYIPAVPKSAPNIVTFPKPTPRRTH